MAAYRDLVTRPPKILTEREVTNLLRVTGSHVAGFRDHVLYGLALATGLREHELVALDVGDIVGGDGRVRRRVRLRVFKRSNADADAQEVLLNDTIRAKLERLLANRRRDGEVITNDSPVFMSSRGRRLSTRRVRSAFAAWQVQAGFERRLSFHSLRHSSISGIYRRTLDIRLAQKFARHASLLSTQRYSHPTDDDLLAAVQDQPA